MKIKYNAFRDRNGIWADYLNFGFSWEFQPQLDYQKTEHLEDEDTVVDITGKCSGVVIELNLLTWDFCISIWWRKDRDWRKEINK